MKLPRGVVATATILLAVLLSTVSVDVAPLSERGTPGAQPVHNSSGYCIAPDARRAVAPAIDGAPSCGTLGAGALLALVHEG